MAVFELSEGALQQACQSNQSWHHEPPYPILQVVELRRIEPTPGKLCAAESEYRYRIIVSDGRHCAAGMLAPLLNHLVESGQLKANTIVQAISYTCDWIGVQHTMLLMRCEIVAANHPTLIVAPGWLDLHCSDTTHRASDIYRTKQGWSTLGNQHCQHHVTPAATAQVNLLEAQGDNLTTEQDQVLGWLQLLMPATDLSTLDKLHQQCRTAEWLCAVVNELRPGLITDIDTVSNTNQWRHMNNTYAFTEACQRLGVPADICAEADKILSRDPATQAMCALRCLVELRKVVPSNPAAASTKLLTHSTSTTASSTNRPASTLTHKEADGFAQALQRLRGTVTEMTSDLQAEKLKSGKLAKQLDELRAEQLQTSDAAKRAIARAEASEQAAQDLQRAVKQLATLLQAEQQRSMKLASTMQQLQEQVGAGLALQSLASSVPAAVEFPNATRKRKAASRG